MRGLPATDPAKQPLPWQKTQDKSVAIGLSYIEGGKATIADSDLQQFAKQTGSLHFSELYGEGLVSMRHELPGRQDPAVRKFYQQRGETAPPWPAVFEDLLSRFAGRFVINLEGLKARPVADPAFHQEPLPEWTRTLPADLVESPEGTLMIDLARRGGLRQWVGGEGGTMTESEILAIFIEWPNLYRKTTGLEFDFHSRIALFRGGTQVWPAPAPSVNTP